MPQLQKTRRVCMATAIAPTARPHQLCCCSHQAETTVDTTLHSSPAAICLHPCPSTDTASPPLLTITFFFFAKLRGFEVLIFYDHFVLLKTGDYVFISWFLCHFLVFPLFEVMVFSRALFLFLYSLVSTHLPGWAYPHPRCQLPYPPLPKGEWVCR